ncbi:hypothetical protein WNY59_06425 [Ahrensia kielensis]|uniref:Restriction endonuclease n=1 Tax=Ahrensia kielensis TaxID=76980 RepID=A0ABU9T507_9HYPH
MDKFQFESLLQSVCKELTNEVRSNTANHRPSLFEKLVRETMSRHLKGSDLETEPNINQGFPDIVVGSFGVEVKATESDSWRCIANSVSEGQRAKSADFVYLVYGKMGGVPEVKWADYGASIVHVRTSHVPRFEIEIGSKKSLFSEIGIRYDEFRLLPMEQKMPHIRKYARSRLRTGERLWWLEDAELDEQSHSLPLEVQVYMELDKPLQRQYRAEAALMCPQIVGPSRQGRGKRGKYVDATIYLMTYRGVLCPQSRDLFSAGSVAGKARGGNYLLRSLLDIQEEIRIAAKTLEPALFQEYWGSVPDVDMRILTWLKMADARALSWRPSDKLFLAEQKKI